MCSAIKLYWVLLRGVPNILCIPIMSYDWLNIQSNYHIWVRVWMFTVCINYTRLPHLSIKSYTVVATKEPLFWVHHLRHLQVGPVDVIVQLWQPLWVHKGTHTNTHAELNSVHFGQTQTDCESELTLKSLLFSKTTITGLLMSAMSSCRSDFHR